MIPQIEIYVNVENDWVTEPLASSFAGLCSRCCPSCWPHRRGLTMCSASWIP